MGGNGPQPTLDFDFGAFHDRAFHETTHRPHSWLPPTRQTVLFSSAAPSGAVSFRLTLCPLGTVILWCAFGD